MKPVDITIIVPAYNCEAYIGQCLDSMTLTGEPVVGLRHFQVVVVDDASTDGTLRHAVERGLHFAVRTERGGELASIGTGTKRGVADRAFWEIERMDRAVIAHVCGDDWVPDIEKLLTTLVAAYQDDDCWMTYGSWEDQNGGAGNCAPLPPEAHERGDYRDRPWVTSHLRTYRWGLWRRIPLEQLIDPKTDKPWFYGTDLAMMYPMLEMAQERAVYIPDILYTYRRHEGNVTPGQYADCCERVRALARLARLEAL